MQACVYLLVVAASFHPPAAAAVQEPERSGYSLAESGFAGRFEDLLLNRLELEQDGDVLRGRLLFGREYEIEGSERDGAVVGTARTPDSEEPFSAEWQEDRLQIVMGEQLLWLRRSVEPLAVDLGAPRADPERLWTIAVYMGADNDLEVGGLIDLMEMAEGLPEKGVDVIVLVDRAKEHWTDEAGDWTDSAVFRIRRGGDPELIGEIGEPDMTDPRTLAGFVSAVYRSFPAAHHAALFWDHGGGWQGLIADEDVPGREGTSLMDLQSLRLGLHAGMLHSRVLKLDLVAFDACLMAHLEVAVGLADLAEVLVASQALVAGAGFPYDRVLPLFAGDRPVREIAADIVSTFGAAYEGEHDPEATLFAIDLARVGPMAALLDALAVQCLPVLDAQWPAFARALYYGECYEPRTERTLSSAVGSLDLVDLLRRLRTGTPSFPAAAEADELQQAVAAAVIAAHTGEQRRLSHGLSVYGPHKTDQMRLDYLLNWLGGANHWTELLMRVHAAAAADPQPVELRELRVLDHDGNPAASVPQFGGCSLHATVTGNGIVQVQQWDSTRDGAHWLVLRKNFVVDPYFVLRVREAAAEDVDLVMPQFVDGENRLQSELTGMNFAVSNGELQVLATLDMATPSSQAPFVARARLHEPGAAAPKPIAIEFHRALWLVQAVYDLTPAADGRVEPRRIQPAADALVGVLLETLEDDGTTGILENEAIPWKDGPRLVLSMDEPGRNRADLIAETMDGRRYHAACEYELAANPDLERWSQSWRAYDPAALTGIWRQSLAVGPERFQATGGRAEFLGPHSWGPGCFSVRSRFPAGGGEEEVVQIWVLEQLGVPSLRIVMPTVEGRTLCWYGPAVIGTGESGRFIAMKALNFGGLIWRWEQDGGG
ncbi:MAG: hypothetical protein EYC70_05955 [Planctomycetota bacterium]|nr:MAG: hypothetical protein EYC70_05955 [Planctomycetota bacterium]